MPTPTKGARLGGSPSHERIILANLASQLFEHGKITTTEAKAKRLRPVAEKLITKAKRGDLHARRQVMATIRDKSVVHVLFTEIAPTFAEREGGYLRITKVGNRKGDNAPLAQIELVTESVADSKKANTGGNAPAKQTSSARKAAGRRAAAAPATAAPAEPVAPSEESEPVVASSVADVEADTSTDGTVQAGPEALTEEVSGGEADEAQATEQAAEPTDQDEQA